MSKEKIIVDISFWQDPDKINYDVLASQIDGVIIRAAYGTSKDTKFEKHYAEFKKRNVPIGAYHYILGNQDMRAQANVFLDAIKGKTLKKRTWIDVEDTRQGTALKRQNVLDYAALVLDAGIYSSYDKWQTIMQIAKYGAVLTDRLMWAAHWNATKPKLPTGWTEYYLWQYTSEGRLDGYNGNLDCNRRGTVRPAEPPEPDEVLYRAKVTATAGLRVRTGAGLNYPIAAPTMVYGTIVEVYEVKNGWCRHNKGGWSDGQWLERIDDEPEPPVIPDPVEPEPVIPDGLLDVPHYSQTDPLWASDMIGASNFNIGAKGCLLTITAAGLTFFGFECNPMAYNCLASARGGYLITEENGKKYANMYWKFPDELTKGLIVRDEYQTFASGTGWEQSANAILAKDKPVWCEVRLNNYQHWVLIFGKLDGDYWILDPIDGRVKVMNYPQVFRTVSYSKRGA